MKPHPPPAPSRTLRTLAGLAVGWALAACAAPGPPDTDVYRRAESQRIEYLEREVERMRADLRQAEEAMINLESGMRGDHTQADAVSALAEARVALEDACEHAPWRENDCRKARGKLEEAERLHQGGRMGAAVFFASRAERIADDVAGEAREVATSRHALFVRGARVNLRSGPSTDEMILGVLTRATPVFQERRDGEWVLVRTHSGRVGWIYGSLLSPR